MRPGINPGDLLFTREVPASTLKVGQIVVLKNPTTLDLYAHRIVSIIEKPEGLSIQTKGDGNPVADAEIVQVNPLQLVPRGEGHLPVIGRAVLFFSSRSGRLFGVWLLLFAFTSTLLRWIVKMIKPKKTMNLLPHEKEVLEA